MRPASTCVAFSLIEMLVTIGLVMILATLGVVTMGKFLERASGIHCVSNLKQIGMATVAYASEHGGELPFYYYQPTEGNSGSGAIAGTWFYLLAPYLSVPRTEVNTLPANTDRTLLGTADVPIEKANVFTCPGHRTSESTLYWKPKPMSFPTRIPVSYSPSLTLGTTALYYSQSHRRGAGILHPTGYTMYPIKLHEIATPTKKIWICDSSTAAYLNTSESRWLPGGNPNPEYHYPYYSFTRHDQAGNALFFDGHVERMPLTTFTEYPLGLTKALVRYFHPFREAQLDE